MPRQHEPNLNNTLAQLLDENVLPNPKSNPKTPTPPSKKPAKDPTSASPEIARP